MKHHQPHARFLIWLALLWTGAGFLAMSPAAVRAQDEPTATPDAEGVIYAGVRPGDSLWAVAVRSHISINELLSLNNLSQNSLIFPGQLLIVGYGTPAPTPTLDLPTPTITATRQPPTPTQTPAPPPRTAICLAAFDDANGNGVRNLNEPLRAAVAFTVFNEQAVIDNYVTDGISEPHCLENLAPGNYKVTRSVNLNETLTTDGDWAITLARGSVLHLEFGSYTVGATTPLAESGESGGPPPAVIAATPAALPHTAIEAEAGGRATTGDRTGVALIIFGAIGFVGLFVAAVLFLIIRRGRFGGPGQRA